MCVTWNRSLFIVISKTTLKVTAANSNWNEKNNRILVKMGIIRSSHKYKWNYCYIIFTVISRYLLSLMISMRHGQYAGCDNSSTCHSENFIQNSDLAVMRNCLPLRFTAVRSVSVCEWCWLSILVVVVEEQTCGQPSSEFVCHSKHRSYYLYTQTCTFCILIAFSRACCERSLRVNPVFHCKLWNPVYVWW